MAYKVTDEITKLFTELYIEQIKASLKSLEVILGDRIKKDKQIIKG